MNFEELLEFIEQKMKLSHVYQPLLIGLLIRAGGTATLRSLARDFASADEANVSFYENRIKQMPVKVLASHGVIKRTGELVSLEVSKLSFEQKSSLLAACETRMAKFTKERGLSTWTGMLNFDPIEESLRYEVLKRDRVCCLCGATKDDSILQVDHIKPRSLGGTNDLSNLQTLCAPCNRGKSNRDDESFVSE